MRKRKPATTSHQKQMRFFTILFGGIMIVVMAALMWFLNRPRLPGN